MKFDVTIKDASLEELEKLVGVMTAPQASVEAVITHNETEIDDDNDEPSDGQGLDSEGMPWDERIHASSKTKKKDGAWTRRRNVPDAEYDAVVAELKAGQAEQPVAAAPQAEVAVPPAPVAPVAPVPTPAPAPTEQPVAAAPQAEVAVPPAPAPAPAAPTQNTLTTVMQKIQQGFASGKMSGNYIHDLTAKINAQFGTSIVNLPDIAANQEMIDFVVNTMIAEGN